jgi:hypothetical protein
MLVGGHVKVTSQATLIVQTPVQSRVPPGLYAVVADLTMTGSGSLNSANDHEASQIRCWITPDSAGKSNNSDGVRVAATISDATQTLSVNDLVSTTASRDQIDLVCSTTPSGSPETPRATVTQASIIAIQVTDATRT